LLAASLGQRYLLQRQWLSLPPFRAHQPTSGRGTPRRCHPTAARLTPGASLKGTANADRIYGRDGCDYIVARGGKDYVEGNQQMDQIYGGSGPDNIIGGPGHDHVWGDDGNDTINTTDGDEEGANIEEVHGGGGRDVCTVDDEAPAGPGGKKVSSCEKLTRLPL